MFGLSINDKEKTSCMTLAPDADPAGAAEVFRHPDGHAA
jgi:hypothetical protein